MPSPQSMAGYGYPSLPSREADTEYPSAFWPSPSELKRAFHILDQDGDGRLWAADLGVLLQVAYGVDARDQSSATWLSLLAPMQAASGQVSLRALCRSLDSGRLFSQLAKMPLLPQAEQRHQAELALHTQFSSICEYVEAFCQLDADGNGVICARDLRKVLRRLLGAEFSVAECREVLRGVDRDWDGVVGLGEFGLLLAALGLLDEAPGTGQT